MVWRDTTIAALLLTVSACCVFALLYRPPVSVSGSLTVNSVRFEALPPVHSRGIFASDNNIDLSIADFVNVRSIPPAPQVVVESATVESLLRLSHARLESLEVVHPVSVWLSTAEDSLRILVTRRRGITDPLCRVRVYANSEWLCGGCRYSDPGQKSLSLPPPGESSTYDIYPRSASLQLAIRLNQANPLPVEAGISLANGSNLTFLGKGQSAIVEGVLTLSGAPPLKIERHDGVEVLGLKNAEINRLEAVAAPPSHITVVFAGRAGSVRYGKTLNTISEINPTLLETVSGADRVKAFKSACELIGGIGGVLGLLTSLKAGRYVHLRKRGKRHARSKKVY
jgi:hypothetical protein